MKTIFFFFVFALTVTQNAFAGESSSAKNNRKPAAATGNICGKVTGLAVLTDYSEGDHIADDAPTPKSLEIYIDGSMEYIHASPKCGRSSGWICAGSDDLSRWTQLAQQAFISNIPVCLGWNTHNGSTWLSIGKTTLAD